MTSGLVILACVVLIAGLIYMYGKSKETIGETRKVNKQDGKSKERESKAKEIESKPAPNSPDDVADAWDRMRKP